ncbi:hypothetical protein NQ314_006344 [Rhamnusium bicolor]|uniref:ATP-dependent DNA ligase family profile domain-containing protein n=1 Tax=Rhamnusium bicolor TaxID=1586634 RepID=A0AAV8Z4C3_9CUCU|nr:hypothetical protein NQ314_006344 [Rhamnusium bicolor]
MSFIRLSGCRTENVKSCILDCEAVAWDKEKKQILPFQILSTRKRKVWSVYIFVFLYHNLTKHVIPYCLQNFQL